MSAKTKTGPHSWLHCNECGHDTLHTLVTKIDSSRTYDEDRYDVTVGSTWRIFQCSGCEEVLMSRVDWCSEDDPGESYIPTYFPPQVSRRKPAWLMQHPELNDYIHIFDEIYKALHADSRRLAMMGTRAVLDMAMMKMVGGDAGNFSSGMDKLVETKRLTSDERQLIDAAFDAGSAAMHRGHQPAKDDLNTTIDIVERVIHAEVLKKQAKALADATPKRPPKKVKTKKKAK